MTQWLHHLADPSTCWGGGKIHKKEMKDHDITQPFPLRLLVCSMAKNYEEHCGLIEDSIRKFYSQVSTLTRGE